jgi:CubicO group peptidase (beta-lactamase class C family)
VSPAVTKTDQASAARRSPDAPTAQPSAAAMPGANGGSTASPVPSADPAPSSPTPVFPLPSADAPTATTALTALLQARIERWRVKTGAPGVSVAIVFPDGTRWEGVSGLADVKTRQLVTPDTAFPVASVSKTFTSALILDLVAEGKLSLDRSARSYLPSLPIDKRITIRQLLDHTSGLRDFFLDRRINAALQGDPRRTWSPAMAFRYVGKLLGKPGTVWHYSNTNYLVLGMIAEAVGKAPVADQLRTRFIDPLGMGDTWYQAVERPRAPLATAYQLRGTNPTAKPIPLSDGSSIAPFTSVVTAAGAAGSIASTARDLARWAEALYGGDALDPAALALLLGHISDTAPLHPPIPYGFGVQGVPVAGNPALGHSGRFLGARAAIRWLPRERLAIAVVTNQSRTDPGALVADLVKLLYPPAVPAPSRAVASPSIASPSPTPSY